MKLQIKNRWTDNVMHESNEFETLREFVMSLVSSGANLTDADLSDANLTGANLTGANLTDANLTGAYLSVANLSDANLSDANLSDANLSDANLSGANLTRANLTRADLSRANLTGANLNIPFTPDPDLIKKVAAAALRGANGKAPHLKMSDWHTCETTHCIAGWAIHLHPEGKILEHFTTPYLAGYLLLGSEAASHFFDADKKARAWLENFLEK